MHHIQRKILGELLHATSLPYSKMRPPGVESNHFAYHLEQLVKEGIIVKNDRQYLLAPQGLALVDRMSQEKMVDRLQPHILTVIAITNDEGKTLLYQRRFQPYIEQFGFPLGKIHLEETVHEAAVRELREKTGLTGIPLEQRGVAYVHTKQAGFTITKALCHIFVGQVSGEPALPALTSRGSCSWTDISQLDPKQGMPGFLDINSLIQNSQPSNLFFAELSYELE